MIGVLFSRSIELKRKIDLKLKPEADNKKPEHEKLKGTQGESETFKVREKYNTTSQLKSKPDKSAPKTQPYEESVKPTDKTSMAPPKSKTDKSALKLHAYDESVKPSEANGKTQSKSKTDKPTLKTQMHEEHVKPGETNSSTQPKSKTDKSSLKTTTYQDSSKTLDTGNTTQSKSKPDKTAPKTPTYEEVDLFASLRTEENTKKSLKRKASRSKPVTKDDTVGTKQTSTAGTVV